MTPVISPTRPLLTEKSSASNEFIPSNEELKDLKLRGVKTTVISEEIPVAITAA
jgi:hypothetical protein